MNKLVVAMPPVHLQRSVGFDGDYERVGVEFLGYLTRLCALTPDDAVLDVGCGPGRIAVPLADYLSSDGRYTGFDVSSEAVTWCKENIAAPNFDFQAVDIRNGNYNSNGQIAPSQFRFPYPDASFDVVLLASVFTHMLPSDVQHYLHEVARVLKWGGRCLSTYFLVDQVELDHIRAHKSFDELTGSSGIFTICSSVPESGVIYSESFIRGLYDSCALRWRGLHYGSWCVHRADCMSYQDVVTAIKTRID